MSRTLIIATTFVLILSCNEREERALPSTKIVERKIPHSPTDIIFNYTAEQTTRFAPIKITGSLRNETLDTVYFLSSDCDGKIYSLQYDTAKFELFSLISCVANFPIIEKILPKSEIGIVASFWNKNNYKDIKLGFDFYEVDKSFKLGKIGISEIYDRGSNDKNIIWADIQKLK